VSRFREAWAVDYEFRADPGERPWPVCMVAHEVGSGTEIRLWRDELLALKKAPFDTGKDSLFVAYYASAEIGCFLELGWPLPSNILDLFTEYRCTTNGFGGNASLLAALAHYNIPAAVNAGEKDAMRNLVIRQTEWTEQQKQDILDYCASDVVSLAALYRRMGQNLDWPRSLHRGRYMAAVARMERNGVPIDVPNLTVIRENWKHIKLGLITGIDQDYHIYDGTTFKQDRFTAYCAGERIRWPKLPSGRPRLDSDTFRDMAKVYPQIHPLHELRVTLGEMRSRLVGMDVIDVCCQPFGRRPGAMLRATLSSVLGRLGGSGT
jgi:DNA polymerase I